MLSVCVSEQVVQKKGRKNGCETSQSQLTDAADAESTGARAGRGSTLGGALRPGKQNLDVSKFLNYQKCYMRKHLLLGFSQIHY